MNQIEPSTLLEIQLEVQEWNTIVEIMCKSTGFPYVTTAPLIEKLSQKMQAKAQAFQKSQAPATLKSA